MKKHKFFAVFTAALLAFTVFGCKQNDDSNPEKCTLTYDSNGGSGEMKSTTGDEGTEITLTENSFTKTGYTFSEWNTKADGKGEKYPDKAKIKLTANTTLYANWKANTYTVTFDTNGGSGDAPAEIQATYDVEFALPENTFTKIGYNFAGWNTKADGNGKDYEANTKVKNLTAENNETVTLYAQWADRGTHKISYELNGGSHIGTQKEQFKETEDVTLGTAGRTGYTFSGWYEAEDCTGTAVTSWNAGEKTEDVTLYAKWEAIVYSITYELDGGTNAEGNPASYTIEDSITLEKPTKDDYTFDGWYESSNFSGTAVSGWNAGEKTENITLYAKWLVADKFIKVSGVPINGSESWTPASDVFVSGRVLDIEAFWMSDHEVTRGEYKKIMGSDPSTAEAYDKDGNKLTGTAADNNPVNKVSWYDAIVYCNKRSIKEGLTPCYTIKGSNEKDSTNPDDWEEVPTESNNTWNAATCNFTANGYRLPTEVEWEWAARGGNEYTYAGSDSIDEVAWSGDNTEGSGTRDVKTKKSNGYGLYDMSGNVWEWCWDWWSENISSSTTEEGASSGANRVDRGGFWGSYDDGCEVAYRDYYDPYIRSDGCGLRVVRKAE